MRGSARITTSAHWHRTLLQGHSIWSHQAATASERNSFKICFHKNIMQCECFSVSACPHSVCLAGTEPHEQLGLAGMVSMRTYTKRSFTRAQFLFTAINTPIQEILGSIGSVPMFAAAGG